MTTSENQTQFENQNAASGETETAQATPSQDSAPSQENNSQTEENETSQPKVEMVTKQEFEEVNNKYLRLMSEFDNFRKRTQKEKVEIIDTANGKLLGKLSEVKDNFERAFSPENKATELEAFEKGMAMIRAQFDAILSEFGLEVLDPKGQVFDPNCHEAFMQQPSSTVPENHVITVFQKGYKIKEKIIKTAKVIVSSGAEE